MTASAAASSWRPTARLTDRHLFQLPPGVTAASPSAPCWRCGYVADGHTATQLGARP